LRVVVVGGGLSGLFTASELVAAGVDDVLVVDAANGPGGLTRTMEKDGYWLEPAAGSFSLPHPALSAILERSRIEIEPASDAATRFVFVDGRLVPIRPGPSALLAPVLSVPAKVGALAEPLRPRAVVEQEESLADFLRRRFGFRAGSLIAWLMASGVYAGDPERLSAEAAFPILGTLEREHGSVALGGLRARRSRSSRIRPRPHVPTGGMTVLAESLASSLQGRFRGGFAVESVRRRREAWEVSGPETITADVVVLAVRPEIASKVLGEALGDQQAQPKSAPVLVVGLGGTGAPLPTGFGVLVGPDEGLATRGVLFESSYAPSRAPTGSWLAKMIIGGAGSRIPHGDDGAVIEVAREELARIVSREVRPEVVIVARHEDGIPQYDIGHRTWLQGVDATLRRHPSLHLAGWAYRGVGVGNQAAEAARLAREITSAASR
jgi:protoporphyrinogen/coproporphyrinogen III oxidase